MLKLLAIFGGGCAFFLTVALSVLGVLTVSPPGGALNLKLELFLLCQIMEKEKVL